MSDSVLTYLDDYCERAGQAGLFAEPFNAVTNLFFIAVAVMLVRGLRRLPVDGWKSQLDLWLLTLFLFGIGIGSGLWHMVPVHTTLLMDVIPITLFINLYIISALRRLFHFSWVRAGLGWATYFAASIAAQKLLPPDLLNGTIMYIPTYATLVVLTVALWARDRAVGKVFVQAVLVWSMALVFRTIDMEICSRFAFGTHFLWHTLNAWVLWRLMQVLLSRVGRR